MRKDTRIIIMCEPKLKQQWLKHLKKSGFNGSVIGRVLIADFLKGMDK